MQIVIDIPKEYYKIITEIPNHQCTADMLIIKNGTPLPKGHGRLIDADVIRDHLGNSAGFDLIGRCIDDEPTIVEADSEVEE